jgi:hypothetical protein
VCVRCTCVLGWAHTCAHTSNTHTPGSNLFLCVAGVGVGIPPLAWATTPHPPPRQEPLADSLRTAAFLIIKLYEDFSLRNCSIIYPPPVCLCVPPPPTGGAPAPPPNHSKAILVSCCVSCFLSRDKSSRLYYYKLLKYVRRTGFPGHSQSSSLLFKFTLGGI